MKKDVTKFAPQPYSCFFFWDQTGFSPSLVPSSKTERGGPTLTRMNSNVNSSSFSHRKFQENRREGSGATCKITNISFYRSTSRHIITYIHFDLGIPSSDAPRTLPAPPS